MPKRLMVLGSLLIVATPYQSPESYGVATISRLIKIIGLFCRITSLSHGSFTKETYNFDVNLVDCAVYSHLVVMFISVHHAIE